MDNRKLIESVSLCPSDILLSLSLRGWKDLKLLKEKRKQKLIQKKVERERQRDRDRERETDRERQREREREGN